MDRYNTQNSRTFLGWMVSAPDNVNSSQLDYVKNPIKDDGVSGIRIFESLDSDGQVVRDESVRASLIPIDEDGIDAGAYAYWIEDEGVKAKVSYTENVGRKNNLSFEMLQRSRLAASPGIDFAQLDGLFEKIDGFKYPIDDSENDAWRTRLPQLSSVNQFQFLDPNIDDAWWDGIRHDATLYSFGLLTNVREGGLRKDLTLAFEMDGTQDDPDRLTNFNASDFVGSGGKSVYDTTTAIDRINFKYKQPFHNRYVYAYDFTTDKGNPGRARGPTWHNVRDYYNLYKRLTKTGSDYQFKARAMFPNRKQINNWEENYGRMRYVRAGVGTKMNQHYSHEYTVAGKFMYQPTKGTYAPVFLGYRFIFGVEPYDYIHEDSSSENNDETVKLRFVFDPVVYLWNPYDTQITLENYKLLIHDNIPVGVVFHIDGARTPNVTMSKYLEKNDPGKGRGIHFYMSGAEGTDIVMNPGEVRIFTAGPASGTDATPMRLYSEPGGNLSLTSGILLEKHPISTPSAFFESGQLRLNITKKQTLSVDLDYVNHTKGGGWFHTWCSLVDDSDLAGSAGNNLFPETDQFVRLVGLHSNPPLTIGSGNKIPTVSIKDIAYTDLLTHNEGGLVVDEDGKAITDNLTPPGAYFRQYLGYFDHYAQTSFATIGVPEVKLFTSYNPMALVAIPGAWRATSPDRFLRLKKEAALNQMLPDFDPGGEAYWGKTYNSGTGSNKVVMREIPKGPLVSLVSLRHGDLAPYFFEPVHAIGNSYSHPFLQQKQITGSINATNGEDVYDSSWLFNDALWDGYFFSSIAPAFSIDSRGYQLTGFSDDHPAVAIKSSLDKFFTLAEDSTHGNTRLLPYLGDDSAKTISQELALPDGYRKIAKNLMVDGAFNVNSTSVEAWAALLGANRGLKMNAFGSGGQDVSVSDDKIPFPKTLFPVDGSGNAWSGYSGVSKSALLRLAERIVEEVKQRGPFMSLADFINRRLENGARGVSGAIQAAIDSIGINNSIDGSEGTSVSYSEPIYKNKSAGGSSSAADISGHLSQADVLQSIAPVLSARSDTFRIRSYGKKQDSVSGNIFKVLCEAVVQRMPEYIDESNNSEDPISALNAMNLTYGRRFKIVGFKWLSLKDI